MNLRKIVSLVIVAAMFAAIVAVPTSAFAATGSKLTITASGKAASIHTKVKLTGTLKTDAGKPIKQVFLKLEKKASTETSWTVVKKARTNSKGRALVNVRPAKDAQYRLVFAGSSKYAAATSAAIKITGYQPDTILKAGAGDATETVTLRKGLAVFTIESTSAPFAVSLLDSKGKVVADLVDEANGYSGEQALKIAKTGKYMLAVKAVAGSPWTVKIVQPRKLSAKGFVKLSGTGDQVSDVFALTRKNKSYWFKWTNPNGTPIGIVIRNQDGTIVKTIASSSAKSGMTKKIKLSKGLYVIEVEASGPWTVAFTK